MTHPAEHELQVAILEYVGWLRHPDCVIFAIPNGGYRSRATGARMKREGALAGAADLAVVLPGGRGTAFLEVKTLDGRLSPEQREFERRVTRAGARYAVVRTIDEARDVLAAWGALR